MSMLNSSLHSSKQQVCQHIRITYKRSRHTSGGFAAHLILLLISFSQEWQHCHILPRMKMWKAVNKTRRVFWGGISDEIPNKKSWAGNHKANSSLFAHLRAANEHFLPQRALKFLQRNLIRWGVLFPHPSVALLSGLPSPVSQAWGWALVLLHVAPGDLHWDERLCTSIKHYLCIILITHKLISCICSYSWFLRHLFYNNNFKSNVLRKEMNKHKTFKRGKLMWDFRQVIYLSFWLTAIL